MVVHRLISPGFLAIYICFLLVIAPGSTHCSSPPTNNCRAVPGSPDWPLPTVWNRFNESLGGGLIAASAPGAVCHPGQPSYDAERCSAIQSEWETYEFHQNDPVSVMWNQFSNDTCLPDPGDPCSPAGYPAYVVNATCAAHVKAAIDFARQYNIRLVVKSTGHDYIGRSIAPQSLSIWVHHLQDIQIHDYFQPKGCQFTIKNSAVTAGGGAQMLKLYQATDIINQTVVGGGGETVSVGGYITGGGHSILAPRYGLAADQVLEMEVVTPMGYIVTANECQNQDLFWAMRGGGGSTFGVITSVTMKTHPSPKILAAEISITTQENARFMWDLVAYILSQFPYLQSKGISGYTYTFPSMPNPLDNGTTRAAGFIGSVILQDTLDQNDMLTIWAPIFEHVNKTWGAQVSITSSFSAHPSFLNWYSTHHDTSEAGVNQWVGSRLLDAKALTANVSELGIAFEKFSGATVGTAYLVSGPGVWNAKPRGGSNSICPAWRSALVHATAGSSFLPLNATANAAALAEVNIRVGALRKLAPDTGAYMNEDVPNEPDWQHQFWGENYSRLKAIKRTVDPGDVLWCNPCVGNERWHEVGDRLCQV